VVHVNTSQPSDAAWDAFGNFLLLDRTWTRILLFTLTELHLP
jgi:hypothetical protein